MSDAVHAGPSQRCLKVGEEVRRLLSAILRNYFFEDTSVSSASITVTEVQMSPDLKHAKVYLMPLGGASKDRVLSAVQDESPRIRHLLAKKIVLKNIPALDFRIDETFDSVDAINKSLESIS